jgi:hypothetical protein
VRLTPDERQEWVRERLLQALYISGGWLSRSALRAMAFGGEQVWADEIDLALDALVEAALIERALLPRLVGKHGRPTSVYRATVTTVPALEPAQDQGMDPHAAREDVPDGAGAA